MHQPFSLPAGNRATNRRQAYALLLLGVVFLFIAWLGILNPYALGVLLFGLGMLGVAPLNPRRFLSAGWLTTSLGVATFLLFRNYIPASQTLTAHLLAIGLGLLGIAWMAQRGYTSTGGLTPGLFMLGVTVIEFLRAAHLTPSTLVPFALSLMPCLYCASSQKHVICGQLRRSPLLRALQFLSPIMVHAHDDICLLLIRSSLFKILNSLFALFWNARRGGQLCNNVVHYWLRDRLFATLWHPLFQAHFTKAHR